MRNIWWNIGGGGGDTHRNSLATGSKTDPPGTILFFSKLPPQPILFFAKLLRAAVFTCCRISLYCGVCFETYRSLRGS